MLLRKSGYVIRKTAEDTSIGDAFETAVLDTVNRKISFDDLVGWFRARIQKLT